MPLIVVPTPIGNMEDMTLRGLRVLREAQVIACEDTRRTLQLLNFHGIRTPMVSCHEHNERSRARELLGRVRRGETVALVSDAGTPGLSDPGAFLLSAALAAGLPVDVLPGATALVPGLLLSGLPPQPFTFYGFLPEGGSDRRRALEALKTHPWTLVFYLSPHKAERHLEDLTSLWGDRAAVLVREISKIHQEAVAGTLPELLERARGGFRGELVLVVSGAPDSPPDDEMWRREARTMAQGGHPWRDIAKELGERYGIPKNRVKALLFAEDEGAEEEEIPGQGLANG